MRYLPDNFDPRSEGRPMSSPGSGDIRPNYSGYNQPRGYTPWQPSRRGNNFNSMGSMGGFMNFLSQIFGGQGYGGGGGFGYNPYGMSPQRQVYPWNPVGGNYGSPWGSNQPSQEYQPPGYRPNPPQNYMPPPRPAPRPFQWAPRQGGSDQSQ